MVCSFWPWCWSVSNGEEQKVSAAILTISVTVITLFCFLFLRKSKKATPPLPPGPWGLPVMGYLPFLGTFLHKKFTELNEVYGPIYKLWLGNKLCIVISSPSLAKEVVRDKDTIFANRDPPIAAKVITYGGNDILWSSYGPEWKKIRKVFVREMLSNTNLDACYPLREREVKKAIRDVFSRADNSVNFGEFVFEIVANAIIKMLCGGTLEGQKLSSFVVEFRRLAEEIMMLQGKPNVSDFFPVLARFDFQGLEKQTRKVFLFLEKFLNPVIEQRLNMSPKNEKSEKKRDFLQILLDFNKNGDAETSITSKQLKALLIDIVVGGTDTTSTMLEWAMTELILHQEVMKKVYQELDEVVGINNVVEEFHLPKLQYLDAVLKETFRLHPALPLLVPHFSSQSCILGGYTIPKGTTVFLNVHAIHRDPLLWNNPSEFRPETFLNSDEHMKFDYSGNNFQYLPFGSGRRVCAGIPLAERMMMYVLASLLHSFEWKLPCETQLELSEKFGIVIKKMNPLILVPKPRLSNLELY